MPIDPNISLQFKGTPIPNPLELMGALNDVRKRVNENLAFQQQNDAQVAFGELARPHIRPDGTIDEPGLAQALAADPRTSRFLPEFFAQAQQRLKADLEIQTAKVNNARNMHKMMGEVLGSLTSLGPNVTKADVIEHGSRLIGTVGDRQFAAKILAEIKALPNDGPALAKALTSMQLQAMEAREAFDRANPVPQQVQLGDRVDIVQASQVPGIPMRTVGSLGTGATPALVNESVPIYGDKGEVIGRLPLSEVQTIRKPDGTVQTTPGASRPDRLAPDPGSVQANTIHETGLATYITTDLSGKISAGEQMAQTQEKMREYMDRAMRTGGLQEKRLAWAQLAQGLGMNEWAETIAGGDLAASQAFVKKTFDAAIERLKTSAPAGWQMPQAEVFKSLESGVNVNMDPRAIELMFQANDDLLKLRMAERTFLLNNPQIPAANRRDAWTAFATQQGMIKLDRRERETPPLVRPLALEVPAAVRARINDLPDGQDTEVTVGGTLMEFRRRGNTITRIK